MNSFDINYTFIFSNCDDDYTIFQDCCFRYKNDNELNSICQNNANMNIRDVLYDEPTQIIFTIIYIIYFAIFILSIINVKRIFKNQSGNISKILTMNIVIALSAASKSINQIIIFIS